MTSGRAATLTCPYCGHRAAERMPTNACLVFYDCHGCGRTLRPLPGDCCVFCSFADRPCPPVAAARSSSGRARGRDAPE
jgi:hypothetical protein